MTNQSNFGRVAVLMGGMSAEREISLQSGKAVLDSLCKNGVDAVGLDVNNNIAEELIKGDFDRAFIALHGRGGEDGTIQGMLDSMGIPYTGSKVLGSALAMDKTRTKQIWMSVGLDTPDYLMIKDETDCHHAVEKLGLPVIVKPVLEGSSIGMSKVETEEQFIPALKAALETSSSVIAERWVEGDEYTAAVVGRRVLPLIKLKTSRDFYDYVAKYEADDTEYICPCGLESVVEKEFAEKSLQAFDAIGASDWGRVDFIVDSNNRPWFIEVNTVPGMTDHSLVPMAAKQSGMSFDELVLEILGGANE